jgi:hypothetical protein
MKRFMVLLLFLLVVGCIATPMKRLQNETSVFLGNVKAEQVNISDVKEGLTDVKWKAETPDGKYSCKMGTGMITDTSCEKAKE